MVVRLRRLLTVDNRDGPFTVEDGVAPVPFTSHRVTRSLAKQILLFLDREQHLLANPSYRYSIVSF